MTDKKLTIDKFVEAITSDSDEEFPVYSDDEHEINVFTGSSHRITVPDDATAPGLIICVQL